jgi:predicted GIY-YIG superfamily endonuclease
MQVRLDKRRHWVYVLWDGDEIIYVGRTVNLPQRLGVFQRRTGIVTSGQYYPFRCLAAAQAEEKRLILLHRPKFNKYVASSPTRLGQRNTAEQNAAISVALAGRSLSAEHRAKLWARRDRSAPNSMQGRRHTPEALAKIREANAAQFADPEKRERHRLACIAAATRRKGGSDER